MPRFEFNRWLGTAAAAALVKFTKGNAWGIIMVL
jgi:hypothetical protein